MVVRFSLLSLLALTSLAAAQDPTARGAPELESADIVVYGATSAGVAAAVQAARMDRTVLLVDPDGRLGGLSSGGLGATDIGNKGAIGGLAREFYRRVARHYADDAAWRWQRREEYGGGGRLRAGEDAMWTFEPHVAEAIFEELVREAGVPVLRGERLDRGTGGTTLRDSRIASIRLESGRVVAGLVFVDATYEGDLMASAGVSYVVGRESNDTHGETLNGVQTRKAVHHQLVPGVDPYVVAGEPSSGLLPGIDPEGPGEEGAGDHRVQAYCLRMCLTDHPENRIPFARPEDYDARDYELLLRNFEAGADRVPWSPTAMPNRKTDTNNNRGVSTDFIGASWGWAEASYAERDALYAAHRRYQEGLMWTLANHPRVPARVREVVSRWGLCRDEFVGHGGWSPQLYVREARRMVSDLVMTQHHCEGREVAAGSVGLAAYTMDSHHVQRYVDAGGHVQNEGDVQVGGFGPYPIAYAAIRPRRTECENLLVPVCLSASHIAFGSIRMEPVFLVLGQSAATAACLAIEGECAVQDVDYAALRARLAADGQVLEPGAPVPPRRGLAPEDFEGIVLDDEAAQLDGFAETSTSVWPWVGRAYRHDGNGGKGAQRAVFRARLPHPGRWEVRVAWSPHPNRAAAVSVEVAHAGGTSAVVVDQRRDREGASPFATIGTWEFGVDGAAVAISNAGTDGYVIVDAVQLVPLDD